MRKIEKSTNIYREHVDVIMDVILLWGDGELLYVYSHRKYVYPIYLALLEKFIMTKPMQRVFMIQFKTDSIHVISGGDYTNLRL